jgi:hypothetical protein
MEDAACVWSDGLLEDMSTSAMDAYTGEEQTVELTAVVAPERRTIPVFDGGPRSRMI